MEKKKVLCLGCGMMGSLLINAYMECGHEVAIVNRTASKADEFVARGATYFEKLSDAIEATGPDLIAFNFDTYETGTIYLNEAAPLIKGRIVVNLSTAAYEKVAEFQKLVESYGGKFIVGNITCYPKNVGPGKDGSFVFAGDKEAYEEVKDILASLSPMNIYMGEDTIAGPTMDTVWLTVHYGLYWGLVQSAAACKVNNVSIEQYADVIKPMVTALLDLVCNNLKEIVAKDKYEVATDAKLYNQALGVGETVEYYASYGMDASVLEAIGALVNKEIEKGNRDKNFEIIIKSIE